MAYWEKCDHDDYLTHYYEWDLNFGKNTGFYFYGYIQNGDDAGDDNDNFS